MKKSVVLISCLLVLAASLLGCEEERKYEEWHFAKEDVKDIKLIYQMLGSERISARDDKFSEVGRNQFEVFLDDETKAEIIDLMLAAKPEKADSEIAMPANYVVIINLDDGVERYLCVYREVVSSGYHEEENKKHYWLDSSGLQQKVLAVGDELLGIEGIRERSK